MIRRVICDVAATIGFETIEAENGGKGLKKLQADANGVELVLLDWNMPGMNGLEVLIEIKADMKLKHIPVMMVTTEGERKNIVAAIQAGAVSYLTKPFTQEDLASKILQASAWEGSDVFGLCLSAGDYRGHGHRALTADGHSGRRV